MNPQWESHSYNQFPNPILQLYVQYSYTIESALQAQPELKLVFRIKIKILYVLR